MYTLLFECGNKNKKFMRRQGPTGLRACVAAPVFLPYMKLSFFYGLVPLAAVRPDFHESKIVEYRRYCGAIAVSMVVIPSTLETCFLAPCPFAGGLV